MVKFIDSNCMLGRWKKSKGICFYKVKDLLDCMDKYRISRSLVFSSFAKYSEIQTGNNILIKNIKGFDRLIPCAVAIPHHSSEFPPPKDFCKYLADNEIRAVRIFPVIHNAAFYTWLWESLFFELQKRKIPVFVDFSLNHWSEEVDWNQIYKFCETFPELPMIMVRIGIKYDRYIYALLKRFKNLYIETSYYLVNNGLEKVTANFGAGKLIFGTGMPVFNPSPPIMMVNLAGIKQKDKEMIAGKNLLNLLDRVDFNVE